MCGDCQVVYIPVVGRASISRSSQLHNSAGQPVTLPLRLIWWCRLASSTAVLLARSTWQSIQRSFSPISERDLQQLLGCSRKALLCLQLRAQQDLASKDSCSHSCSYQLRNIYCTYHEARAALNYCSSCVLNVALCYVCLLHP